MLVVAGGRASVADESPSPERVKPPAGVWQGTLNVGAITLRMVIELKKNDAGEWTGAMDSPDQGAFGIPIDSATFADGILRFESKKVSGKFEGKLAADGKEIVGDWKQGGMSLPLLLKPGKKVAPALRPQEPKPPFPYDVEEVTYENSQAGIKLAGTLTRPRSQVPSR